MAYFVLRNKSRLASNFSSGALCPSLYIVNKSPLAGKKGKRMYKLFEIILVSVI